MHVKGITIEGKKFRSFRAACDYYRVDSSYLQKKSKRTGICKETLLIEKVSEGIVRLEFTYRGENYPSLSHFCRLHGLDPVKVQSLINNRKIERSEAVELALKYKNKNEIPRDRRGYSVTIDGITYQSRAAACRALRVSNSAVNWVMKRDRISFEKAIRKTVPKQ